MGSIKQDLRTFLIAVLAVVVVAGVPAVAAMVYDANNAKAVDGKSAVGSGATLTQAKGKLVAHDGTGRLAGKFLPKIAATRSQIKTSEPGPWVLGTAAGNNTFFIGMDRFDNADASGFVFPTLRIDRPLFVGGQRYRLEALKICFNMTPGESISRTTVGAMVFSGYEQVYDDSNVHSGTNQCYTVSGINAPVVAGAADGGYFVVLQASFDANPSNVDLSSVVATWVKDA